MPEYLRPYNELNRYTREKMLDKHRDSKIIILSFVIGIFVGFVFGRLIMP